MREIIQSKMVSTAFNIHVNSFARFAGIRITEQKNEKNSTTTTPTATAPAENGNVYSMCLVVIAICYCRVDMM